jgi:hypothetical protein
MRQCLVAAGFSVENIGYEKVSALKASSLRESIKGKIRRAGRGILAKFLEIPFAAFSEDLVVITRR